MSPETTDAETEVERSIESSLTSFRMNSGEPIEGGEVVVGSVGVDCIRMVITDGGYQGMNFGSRATVILHRREALELVEAIDATDVFNRGRSG